MKLSDRIKTVYESEEGHPTVELPLMYIDLKTKKVSPKFTAEILDTNVQEFTDAYKKVNYLEKLVKNVPYPCFGIKDDYYIVKTDEMRIYILTLQPKQGKPQINSGGFVLDDFLNKPFNVVRGLKYFCK